LSGELFAHLFFLCNGASVKESLHRRLAKNGRQALAGLLGQPALLHEFGLPKTVS
jgi:hypothetical protein